MGNSLVIIPTYNEKENIAPIIDAVFQLPGNFHILIVDDNSPDKTAEIVKELQKKYTGKLHLLERPNKDGLGRAYISGFKWALKHQYEYIFEMDADFSHDPNDLPRLLKACEDGYDIAIGSRYVKEGKVENWPFGRILMSYFASVYVRMILWINIQDTTSGFKCYHRKVLETMDLDLIQFNGYAFQIEMKYYALKLGFKIKEIPITFKDRNQGQSKMSKAIFKEALIGVWKMRFKNYFPKK